MHKTDSIMIDSHIDMSVQIPVLFTQVVVAIKLPYNRHIDNFFIKATAQLVQNVSLHCTGVRIIFDLEYVIVYIDVDVSS